MTRRSAPQVEQLAQSGLFSVERAITTCSHVAFLRTTPLGARALARALLLDPDARAAARAAGITAVGFGVPGLAPILLDPAPAAARTALAAIQARLVDRLSKAVGAEAKVSSAVRGLIVRRDAEQQRQIWRQGYR